MTAIFIMNGFSQSTFNGPIIYAPLQSDIDAYNRNISGRVGNRRKKAIRFICRETLWELFM